MTIVKYKCGACGHTFEHDDDLWPGYAIECPKCDFYHCGDVDCCVGEPFYPVNEDGPQKENRESNREEAEGG